MSLLFSVIFPQAQLVSFLLLLKCKSDGSFDLILFFEPIFSLYYKIHTYSGAHPVTCPVGTRGSLPIVKVTGVYS